MKAISYHYLAGGSHLWKTLRSVCHLWKVKEIHRFRCCCFFYLLDFSVACNILFLFLTFIPADPEMCLQFKGYLLLFVFYNLATSYTYSFHNHYIITFF